MNKLTTKSTDVVVVKVGTDTLTENGALNTRVMVNIARQIAEIREQGKRLILVSSGAIGSARGSMPAHVAEQVRDRKQALSALGQTKLMIKWNEYFEPYKIHCAQMLVEDRNFETAEERDSLQARLQDFHDIEDVWGEGILPVLNGNDPITAGPIKTDNDRIASEIGRLASASDLIYLTNVDGIYTGDPALETSAIIREVNAGHDDIQSYLTSKRSKNGTGGMQSKYKNAVDFLQDDSQRNAYIGNGKSRDAIMRLLGREIGTWVHY